MTRVVFTFEGIKIEIQCSKEDKMKDVCTQLANKIDRHINKLIFLYDGKMIDLDLKYKEIKNSTDEMNILVYEKETEGIICPKCGENINIDNNNNINEDIKEKLIAMKDLIEMINNSNNMTIEKIKSQMKNILMIIDNILQQIKNNEIKNNNEIKTIDNIITGIIDIRSDDIYFSAFCSK